MNENTSHQRSSQSRPQSALIKGDSVPVSRSTRSKASILGRIKDKIEIIHDKSPPPNSSSSSSSNDGDDNDKCPDPSKGGLKRTLRQRHMTMIAIGGCIGTGLFIGSGVSLALSGPGGSLVAYIVVGVAVYFVMTALGELVTLIPTSGSFATLASRIVDPAAGFAVGWNYWYSYMIMVVSEILASGIVIQYWLPHIHGALWSFIAVIIMFAFNAWSVRGYAEAEYWMSMLKVLAVIAFIIIGIVVDTGKLGGHKYGGENWRIDGAPFVDGAKGFFQAIVYSIFSFLGTELVSIAAGESRSPQRDVPRAINQTFFRILIFYVGSIIILGLIIPWNDPRLMSAKSVKDIGNSPFTIVFLKAGLGAAAHVVNSIVLVTVLSAGNSGLYVTARSLYNLACEGKAPRFFASCTSKGIPLRALIFTTLLACVVFGISFIGNQVIYNWLINIVGVMGLMTWLSILFIHWRFRQALKAKKIPTSRLPYHNFWYPYGSIYSVLIILAVIVGRGWAAFQGGFNVRDFITSYLGIVIFVILYFGWKYFKKTKIVPLEDIDIYTESTVDITEPEDAPDAKDKQAVTEE